MTTKTTLKTKTSSEKDVFTKEDFLKALRKATRPLSPKPSPEKVKPKTSV